MLYTYHVTVNHTVLNCKVHIAAEDELCYDDENGDDIIATSMHVNI